MRPDQACRACRDTNGIDMVELRGGELLHRYTLCTALQVSMEDPYPKMLCARCAGLVTSFAEFRELCHRSEAIWKSYLLDSGVRPQGEIEQPYKKSCLKLEIKEEHQGPLLCDDNLEEQLDDKNILDDNFDNHSNDKEHIGDEPLCRIKREERIHDCHSISGMLNHIDATYTDQTVHFEGFCDSCEKRFSYKSCLMKHVARCGLPGYQMKRPAANTLKIKYTISLFCGICEEESSSLDDAGRHLASHQQSNDLSCKICDYKADDFADLFSHRYSHQPAGVRVKLICFICSKLFNKLEYLEFHLRGKHLNKTPGLCKVCKQSYANYKYFKQHKIIHTGVVFPCNVCNKTFKFEKTRDKHLLIHSKVKPFVCHVCGFGCNAASGLRSHIYRQHTQHETHICSHCGKKFKNSETFKQHTLDVFGDKQFTCSICNKQYRSKKRLNLHFKWHSDEKPFPCDVCDNSYKAKAHLKAHMRKHTGERPYVCNICGAGFRCTSTLNTHKRVHTGERPYKCNFCGKGFSASNNMKKHMHTHTNNKGRLTVKVIHQDL